MPFGAVDELQDGRGAIRANFGKRGLETWVALSTSRPPTRFFASRI